MDASLLARSLATLRWIAVIGQSVAIVAAESVLGLALAYGPLLLGLAALLAFAAYATRASRREDSIGRGQVLAHVAFDIAQLTWQLYWSGGSANPFVSLYLLPIALVGFSLPGRQVVVVAGLSVAGYGLLMAAHRPLPNWLHHNATLFDLHLVGMWVNFLVSAGVITIVAIRLSALLERQRRALSQAREAALRGEGLVAVATQAAATAHALNTPLASIAVLAGELAQRFPPGSEVGDDLALLCQQVGVCRDAVRRLVSEAALDRSASEPLAAIIARAMERLALLRPESRARAAIDPEAGSLRVADPQALEHLAMNLLGNAADASATRGSDQAEVGGRIDDCALVLAFRDRGPGLHADPEPFRSAKADGLGLGFLLAEMIAERLGGHLQVGGDATGGEVVVRLPIADGVVGRA